MSSMNSRFRKLVGATRRPDSDKILPAQPAKRYNDVDPGLDDPTTSPRPEASLQESNFLRADGSGVPSDSPDSSTNLSLALQMQPASSNPYSEYWKDPYNAYYRNLHRVPTAKGRTESTTNASQADAISSRQDDRPSNDYPHVSYTPASFLPRERELKRWDGGSDQDIGDVALEDTSRNDITAWDQFAVNEQNFGVRTTYNEDDYTTSIDRKHPEYKRLAAEADQIALDIERSTTATASTYNRQERGLDEHRGPARSSPSQLTTEIPPQENEAVIKATQSQIRGALARMRLANTMERLWGAETDVALLQARIRGGFARNISRGLPSREPSIGIDEGNTSRVSPQTVVPFRDAFPITNENPGVTEPRPTPEIFAEAEASLKRLESGIRLLVEHADDDSETAQSDSDTVVGDDHRARAVDGSPGYSETLTDNHEGTEGGSRDQSSSDTGSDPSREAETSDSSNHHKRQKRKQPGATDDSRAHAQVTLLEKRSKPTSKRFICCFHSGPGRQCSGTDETISEVIKKLSDWHATHVCDRCWVLKVKDEQSGLVVHPGDRAMCHDYCLSPQCYGTTPSIGHRHRFDQRTCRTKTSRVRPGDGEAVFRFIYQLIHPALEAPETVFTTEHALHLDAVPRQSRRKPRSRELIGMTDDLRKKFEDLRKLYDAKDDELERMKQKVAHANINAERERERVTNLEARTRRIVAMLGDALRTGMFPDQSGHLSLLERVKEDAPTALNYLS